MRTCVCHMWRLSPRTHFSSYVLKQSQLMRNSSVAYRHTNSRSNTHVLQTVTAREGHSGSVCQCCFPPELENVLRVEMTPTFWAVIKSSVMLIDDDEMRCCPLSEIIFRLLKRVFQKGSREDYKRRLKTPAAVQTEIKFRLCFKQANTLWCTFEGPPLIIPNA